MNEKCLDRIQEITKAIASVGTTIGVFSLELVLLENANSFHGAAKLTTAITKAGKIVKSPSMIGGLTAMVTSSALAGYEAGEAVDYVFNHLRGKAIPKMISD